MSALQPIELNGALADGVLAVLAPLAVSLALVLARVGGLIMTMPVLSAQSVPRRIKVALVMVLGLAVVFTIGPRAAPGEMGALGMALAAARELVTGGVMGLSATLLFSALAQAGQLMGIQMGFGIANLVDPTTLQQAGVISQCLNLLGMLLYLVLDGHLMMISALLESFRVLPLGGLSTGGHQVLALLIELGGQLFVFGLRIALPCVCVVILCNVGLAIVARTVPQVNIFAITFIVTIGAGLIVLSLSIPFIAEVLREVIAAGVAAALAARGAM